MPPTLTHTDSVEEQDPRNVKEDRKNKSKRPASMFALFTSSLLLAPPGDGLLILVQRLTGRGLIYRYGLSTATIEGVAVSCCALSCYLDGRGWISRSRMVPLV